MRELKRLSLDDCDNMPSFDRLAGMCPPYRVTFRGEEYTVRHKHIYSVGLQLLPVWYKGLILSVGDLDGNYVGGIEIEECLGGYSLRWIGTVIRQRQPNDGFDTRGIDGFLKMIPIKERSS